MCIRMGLKVGRYVDTVNDMYKAVDFVKSICRMLYMVKSSTISICLIS